MSQTLKEKIRECKSLPTLPATALQVLRIAEDSLVGMDKLAETISTDPALSSKILLTVNSRFYGLSHKVGSIAQAVALLGLTSVKTLALGFSLINVYNKQRPKGFKYLDFWRRSMYAATAARQIAAKALPSRAEECFIAALLMDLGTLVLDQLLGDEYSDVFDRAASHGELAIIESHALGMDHSEVSGMLAEQWMLPDVLRVPISSHHAPRAVEHPELRKVSEIVWLAGLIGDMFVEPSAPLIAGARKAFLELYGLAEIDSDQLMREIGEKTGDLAPLFDQRLNTSIDYDHLVAKASEQLLELSLAERSQSGGKGGVNRRRVPRVRKDGRISILPCNRGVIGKAIAVKIKDVSVSGIGLYCTRALELGSQFVVQIPETNGKVKSLLYGVVRCIEVGGIYDIGSLLSSVLRTDGQGLAATPAEIETWRKLRKG